MSDRFPEQMLQAGDQNLDPIPGAKLNFFITGTSTPKDTYSDAAKTIPNTNPVVADANGRFGDILMDTDVEYKVVYTDAADVVIQTFDPYSPVRSNPVADIDAISKSADYTVLTADKGKLIEVDASSGPVTITLPAVADATNGFFVYVKKTDSSANAVTIDADGVELIDGKTTFVLSDQYDFWFANTDGTTWHILGKSDLPAAVASDFGSVATVSASGTYTLTPVAVPARNYLINGDFIVDQRRGDGTAYTAATTPANNDDTYLLDRWVLLSDGNDRVDISQETTVVPTGVYSAVKFEVETVSGASEKFGFLQILEARNAAELIDGTVSLAFQARTTSGAIRNLRAHIMGWNGGADAVTSDIVATWGAEGSNPTFVSNWGENNTGSDLSLTDTYSTLKVENIAVDTPNAVNVAIFIHVDDTDLVAGDLLYISDVRLNKGPIALPTARRSFDDELNICERYYQTSFDLDDIVPSATIVGNVHIKGHTTTHIEHVKFRTRMRSVPTVAAYNPSGAETGSWRDTTAGANRTVTWADEGQTGARASAASTVDGNELQGHWAAVAEL